MKYYIALAINKHDPEDVLGLCENSFSMSWEKYRVNLFAPPADTKEYYNIPLREYVKKYQKSNGDYEFGFHGESIKSQGQRQKLRKVFTIRKHKLYHACGRTPAEYEWKWCNHYAVSCSKLIPNKDDYEIRCYRVNSKYCPVRVDLSVREGMNRHRLTFKKYDWRNAHFEIVRNSSK